MANKYIKERHIQISLLLSDIFTLAISIFLAYFIRFKEVIPVTIEVFALYGVLISCFYLLGSYSLRTRTLIWRELGRYWAAIVFNVFLFAALIYFTRQEIVGVFGRGVYLGTIVLFTVIGSVARICIYKWLQKHVRNLRWLIIGSKKHIEPVLKEFKKSHNLGFLYFLSNDDLTDLGVQKRSHLGQTTDLPKHIENYWSGVVVATKEEELIQLSPSLMDMRVKGHKIFDLATFYEHLWFKVPIFYLNSSWFALTEGFGLLHSNIGLRVKRLGDLFLALLLMAISIPLLILAALAIKLTSRGPIIYKQVRTGQGGRDFVIYKLRTMKVDAEKNGAQFAQKNDSRVTPIGKFLRLTRIDELPQLWNVINGDMSFIGPRPERPEFNKILEKDIPFYNMRNLLKPGITGWAQVMYRYGASAEDSVEKLQYDLYYIKNYSLLLDWNICLKTVRVVLGAKGQ